MRTICCNSRMQEKSGWTEMLKQKAHFQWDVEGDENTRFFRSMIIKNIGIIYED